MRANPWRMMRGTITQWVMRHKERRQMTQKQKDLIRDHGPYTLRDDGVIVDCNGVALAQLVPDGAEECEWDRSVIAVLNAVHFGLLG